jgi:hypothetical protein
LRLVETRRAREHLFSRLLAYLDAEVVVSTTVRKTSCQISVLLVVLNVDHAYVSKFQCLTFECWLTFG